MCEEMTPKAKWGLAFALSLVIDLVASGLLLWLTFFKHDVHGINIQFSFLVDFWVKTFDVSFLCVLRVVLVVTSAIAAIKVGDEKDYLKRMEAQKAARQKSMQSSSITWHLRGLKETGETRRTTSKMLSRIPSVQVCNVVEPQSFDKQKVKCKSNNNEEKEFRAGIGVSTLYSVFRLLWYQMYHFFFTGSTAEQIASAILLCTLPVWINAQFFLMRTYVNEALKKQGRFFPGVHHHHLHLKNLPCNWCDLCHKRIQDRQGWRCHMCDFDVCNHCAMRANKSGAEGLIRGDKNPLSKNKKVVTSYKYFCRALSFTSKHISLVAITVACLLVNCGTNLVLPHYTGRILDSVAKQDVSDFTNDIKFY